MAADAALEIQTSGLTIPEAFTLSGVGFNNLPTGGLRLDDVTPGTTDTATLTGEISLAASATIGRSPPRRTP